MAIANIGMQEFEQALQDHDIILIDFWADWCGPCKQFAPVFEKAAEKYTDVHFAKCDTDAEKELAAQFGVRSIPTLAVIREKVLLFNQAGALPENALDELITQVIGLDMDEVRAKIEEDAANAAEEAGDQAQV